MQPTTVMANLTVTDLDRARAFYGALTGRGPDAEPMEGLLEWRFGSAGGSGFQVFLEPDRAGRGGIVLDVDDMTEAVRRFDAAGVAHDAPFDATYSQVLVTADPDGNRVVLTAPFNAA